MSNCTQIISQDSTHAATHRLFERGQNLVQQHTIETLQQALLKFTEALKLYCQVSDRTYPARTLAYIGGIYTRLEENQKALDYFKQTLQSKIDSQNFRF